MGPSLIFIYKSSTAGAPDCFTTPSCVAAARHGGARGVYAKINLAGSIFVFVSVNLTAAMVQPNSQSHSPSSSSRLSRSISSV